MGRLSRKVSNHGWLRWGAAGCGVLLAASLAGAPLLASDELEQDRARQLREAGEIVPLERILNDALSRRRGQILETELERHHGRYLYEVEILDQDGRVWEHKYDARTGELLEYEQE